MQNSTINWDDLRLFLALGRSGSARSAAEALSLSHTTVARRVDQLETRLGTRLFDRSVNGYRLTGAGEAMIESALRAEEAILAAERKLHGQDAQLSGEVRLTTSDLIANHLLMDELVAFNRQYPQIDLTILTSYDVLDLARREADIAIRFMGLDRMPPEDLVGRRLVTASSCYYASAAYLAEHNPAKKDSGARWIGWDEDARYPGWVRSSPFPDVPAYGKFNNALLQVEAARHGMGLAILPCFLGDTADGLQRIPGCKPRSNYDIWLLSHPDLRDAARLRTFRQFIVDAFERKHDLLTGRAGRSN
ncbi:MAG: LysR family transcriptional regulator [Gammaproteobacteria bacterium]|nr:LysR family transcriptional regulator [Gammaproteobacteria bacterium]